MSVRICALSVPFFYDGGIEAGAGWSALPCDLTADQRAVLLEQVGSLIQIHPEDVENLSEYGLKLVGGRLREAIEADGEAPEAKQPKIKGAKGAGK